MRNRALPIILFVISIIALVATYLVWNNLPAKLVFTPQFGTYTHGTAWVVPTNDIDVDLDIEASEISFTISSTNFRYTLDNELKSNIDAILAYYAVSVGDSHVFSQQTCPYLALISIPNVVSEPRKLNLLRNLNCYTSLSWREN